MVTGSTLHKAKLFNSAAKLNYLECELLGMLHKFGWRPQAWAAFPNHYHFVAIAPENPNLATLIERLHGRTSHGLNSMDAVRGRKVWFQYFDTALTYEKSYLARLSYVHRNAVKHGIARVPEAYRWCSARWFLEHGTNAQIEAIMSLPIDQVNVIDDF